MCDTFIYRANSDFWFCKNSDREPDEPQLVEFYPAHSGQSQQQATYVRVTVPTVRNAVLLSRPSWLWGAEMGVNEHGVAIGNQAVYTRLIDRKNTALLGMDLLRLALEQSSTAAQACATIINYLEEYGQAGPSAYRDKKVRYDNAFIVSDPNTAFVLDTAGRFWAKKVVQQKAAISNDLSIATDYDEIAPQAESYARQQGWWRGTNKFNFRDAFRTCFMPWAARSTQRRHCNLVKLAQIDRANISEQAFIPLLRSHKRGKPSSNADVCMHSRGFWRPGATTNSFIVKLSRGPHSAGLPAVWSSFGQPCQNKFIAVNWDCMRVQDSSD